MKSAERVHTCGAMAKNTTDNGTTIRCTVMVISGGLMAKNILGNSKKTSVMAWASSDGRMAENTKENGVVESNTVSDTTEMAKEKRGKASGSMAVVYSG